jgi:hypothetical protein
VLLSDALATTTNWNKVQSDSLGVSQAKFGLVAQMVERNSDSSDILMFICAGKQSRRLVVNAEDW